MNKDELVVVGLGASAGGFEALLKFLQKVQIGNNIAYVIVQHLDPNQPTMLGNLLSKYTQLPIIQINQGDTPQKDTIYYCPPNKDVILTHGKFELSEPKSKSYPKPSVNKFFESLATDKKEFAIGVVLSGTGSDGALGMKAIHQNGGVTIAEDEGAKYFSMPKAAIDTGMVDIILPPELIAEGIPFVIDDRDYFSKQYEVKGSVYKIFELLNKKTQIDFSSYKENTILRRIKKRISETKSKDTDSYLELLYSSDKEVEKLKNELLIIVTSFFRGEDAFKDLAKNLEGLILHKESNDIRVWISGCATGEEAYSLAIIIKEILLKLNLDKRVTIFATDVSDIAVSSARSKTYSIDQMEGVKKEFIVKYFDEKTTGFRPKKDIRDMIVFSKHDVIKDPPFSNLDLISCRNLLIYFNNELQKNIISIFHYSLRFGGLLFLGQSETIGSLSSLFSTVHNKNKIYKKTNDVNGRLPSSLSYSKRTEISNLANQKQNTPNYFKEINGVVSEAISKEYGKNGVIVDGRNYQILYYKGNSSEFISQPKGVVTQDLFKLVKTSLKLDLRACLNEAKKKEGYVVSKKIRITGDEHPSQFVELSVFPLDENKLGDDTYYIAFTKKEYEIIQKLDAKGNSEDFDQVSILEDELSSLKERLQITIEELETSNEELQSTNEELQSTNEELQSTNEELETSNEELQSTNEELQTVNDELSFKNDELEFEQAAFHNVLSSLKTDILIVDQSLNILRYTKGVQQFFDISKIEHPNFSHLLMHANVDLPHLLEDLKSCLQNGKEIAYEIALGKRMFWFRIKRVDFSKTGSSNEKGLVLSFLDRTEIFEKDRMLFNQSKLAAMGEMIGAIAHQWRQPLNSLNINIQNLDDDFEDGLIDKSFLDKFIQSQTGVIMHLSHTIDDFRNYFKADKEKKDIELKNTIIHTTKLLEAQFKTNGIDLEIKGEDFVAKGFENELKQAFLNIISNSKDAILEKKIANGKIKITIDAKDKKVYFCDNGGGVSDAVLERIFEPYYTTKETNKGTGIGLYMTKMIVEEHMKGSVTIYNQNDGLCVAIGL